MAAYLTIAQFKALSVIPASYVDQIETEQAGWTDTQLAAWSAWIDAKLAKRYQVPFGSPAPITVQMWLSRIVTPIAYLKKGIDPTDAQVSAIVADGEAARLEIKEAADSKEGLYELPLLATGPSQGVGKGAPLGYSEQTPYAWTDVQQDAACDEWRNRGGS